MTPEPLSGTAPGRHPGRMAATYAGTRTTTIAAPAQRVHALTDDVREWPRWSPWRASTPQIRRACSGPMPGVGWLKRVAESR